MSVSGGGGAPTCFISWVRKECRLTICRALCQTPTRVFGAVWKREGDGESCVHQSGLYRFVTKVLFDCLHSRCSIEQRWWCEAK